jgi:hypothetical protein
MAYIDRPVLRSHCQEAKRGEAGGHRITRNCEALGAFLLACATTELSLIAMLRLIGATPRGQPGTPAVILPHGRDGLSARRMAVLWTCREPSLCRHVPHEFMRNAVLHLTLIIPATACHQRNYVERYSRFTEPHQDCQEGGHVLSAMKRLPIGRRQAVGCRRRRVTQTSAGRG